ncbi:MAG: hypothetical protein ACK4SZ_02075 [Allosphingosinicella sp.]|uniref:hypothetical protein n=1 Tax=Allosphingosinicella sp. TaxID=2823234 RepID=UPI003920717E
MFLKSLGLCVPLAAGALYFGGVLDAGYSRDVAKSPDQVMAALEDLDVRRQPGSPGTDPSRSGGVAPVFRTERTDKAISFVVMSGNEVATRMTAHLEPLDGGARTRVTATVERGTAPDERTSPAFRSEGLTMGLFAAALQDELDQLEAPPHATAQFCADLEQRLLSQNGGASGVAAVARVHQMGAEMRRNGCPLDGPGGGEFQPVRSQMGPATPESGSWGKAGGSGPEQGGWGGR